MHHCVAIEQDQQRWPTPPAHPHPRGEAEVRPVWGSSLPRAQGRAHRERLFVRESGEQGFAERSLARSGIELAVGLHPRSVGW